MPAPSRDFVWAMRAAGVLVAFATVSGSAMTVATKLSEPPLHVGDILRFQHLREDQPAPASRLLVGRSHEFGCVLDLQVMRSRGGSLVVESLDPRGDYRLHWAGQRTSSDGGNCGPDAELVVNARDLRTIALAAGQADPESLLSLTSN
jgi:hypothetical protein